MKNSIDYFKQTMDDIVFENRNKKYGAYILRKSNDIYILRGLFFVLFTVTAIAVFSLTRKAPVKEIIDIITVNPKNLDDIFNPPVTPEIEKPKLPETASAPLANTQEVKEMKPVEDSKAPDVAVTPNDSLAGKIIANETNLNGTPGGNTTPVEKNSGGSGTNETTVVQNKNEVKDFAEIMPAFDDINRWLQKNIKYPRIAIDAGVEGKVYVEFVVNTDGSITDAKVVRGIGFGCDEEALRAVKAMPKWKPGKQGGYPVRVRMTLPVLYKLNK